MRTVYEIKGLGYWSATDEKFVDDIAADDQVFLIGVSEGADKLTALKEALEFDGYSADKLSSEDTKLHVLVEENKDFLIKVFILYSLDIDIPKEALEQFTSIKNELSTFSSSARAAFLME